LATTLMPTRAHQPHLELVSEQRRERYRARRMADFVTRCREKGLAVTPQRVAILNALLESGDHPSAEEIYTKVRAAQPMISLATVHRTLETLCEAGEAGKVTLLHDAARYDGNTDSHHHVVCIRCYRVSDLEAPQFDRMFKDGATLGEYELLGCAVEIRALCKRCRKASAVQH
jgi:Fur family transcriptional regulator, peroxide stress response regulator